MDLCRDLLSRPVSWPSGWLVGPACARRHLDSILTRVDAIKMGNLFPWDALAMNNCAAGWGGAAAAGGSQSEDDRF